MNCFACSRRRARPQVAADAASLKTNNAAAANAKLDMFSTTLLANKSFALPRCDR
jgi:hypothetical protein